MTLPAGCGLALTGTSVMWGCQPLKQNNCPASMAASSFSLTTPNNANSPCGNCSVRGEWGPRDGGVPARPGLLLVCGGRLPCGPGHYSTRAKLAPRCSLGSLNHRQALFQGLLCAAGGHIPPVMKFLFQQLTVGKKKIKRLV